MVALLPAHDIPEALDMSISKRKHIHQESQPSRMQLILSIASCTEVAEKIENEGIEIENRNEDEGVSTSSQIKF